MPFVWLRPMEKKHPFKKWEVSISEYETLTGKEWKVTRRLAEMSVAETKVFSSKKRRCATIRRMVTITAIMFLEPLISKAQRAQVDYAGKHREYLTR